jgi:plastocyanin
MTPSKRLRLTTAVAGAALVATGCSTGGGASGGASKPVTIAITEHNGTVKPSGDTIPVGKGAKVTFVVSSDAADEIHVHSEPDHEFEVKPGVKQTFSFAIDTPGTYEVESHHLDVVIVKLQVS